MRYLDKQFLVGFYHNFCWYVTDMWANIAYKTPVMPDNLYKTVDTIPEALSLALQGADEVTVLRMDPFSYKPNEDRALTHQIEPIVIDGKTYFFNHKYTKWIKKGNINVHKRNNSAVIQCNGYIVASMRDDHDKLWEAYNGQ